MKPFHRILVATDLTATSEPAFAEAIEMAKGGDTELLIAHAFQPPNVAQAQAAAGGVYEEWIRNLRDQTEERLEPLVERAAKEGVKAEKLVLSGTAYEAITEAAKEKEADLVIMGTHGRKGVSKFFLGSVASRVISTAHCPVLTVRAA
jgi:nucleotide-binding universal stress UspA family protein